MNRIIVEKSVWKKMYEHVISDDNEHFAFFLANHVENQDGVTFLVRDVICIKDSDLESDGLGIKIKLEALLEVTNHARKNDLALIEIHSHPFATKNVKFSRTDYDGFKEFVPYILDSLARKPYAAIVLGQSSADAICWKNKAGKVVDKIVIHGKNLETITSTSNEKSIQVDEKRYDRQIPFGKSAQKALGEIYVAVVGLGGIGSEILQKLSYMGVRNFLLIDDDVISEDNLNRLIGAYASDIGETKITIATRSCINICGKNNVRVIPLEKNVLEQQAIQELIKADFIFGCIDNDGARTLLNEISKSYMIPYLDCAVGINTKDGKIVEIGGRVVFVLPKNPCLQCLNEIDVDEATYFLQTKREQQFNREHGYVSGVILPSPSVVHLNGLVANAALWEFFAYVTKFRSANIYSIYDAQEQKLTTRNVRSDPKCFVCNWNEGKGDKADIISRFARRRFDLKTGVGN